MIMIVRFTLAVLRVASKALMMAELLVVLMVVQLVDLMVA
jgi:hypothetical protein